MKRLLLLAFLLFATPCWAMDPPTFLFKFGSPGSGPGQFHGAGGLCVAPNGHVYVTDYYNYRVQEFDADGNFLRVIGDSAAFAGYAEGPFDVAVGQDGKIFVSVYSAIAVFDASGHQLPPIQLDAISIGANYIALDPTGQFLYVICGSGELDEFDTAGNRLLSIAYLQLSGFGTDADGSVVALRLACTVTRFSPSGILVREWGVPNCSDFLCVAPDRAGHVYTGDGDGFISVFTSDGVMLTRWGGHGLGDGMFGVTADIAAGPQGRIYILDGGRSNIQAYGSITTSAKPITWGHLKALYR